MDTNDDCTLMPNKILKALARMPDTAIHLTVVAIMRARVANISTDEILSMWTKRTRTFVRALHDRVDEVERLVA